MNTKILFNILACIMILASFSSTTVTISQEVVQITPKIELELISTTNRTYSFNSLPNFMQIHNNYLFAAVGTDGLEIWNIEDPSAPVLIGNYSSINNAMHFQIVDNYLFLADFTYGLRIIDISDPTTPTNISQIYLRGEIRNQIQRVQVVGDLVFLGRFIALTNQGPITVVDISDIESPTILQDFDFGHYYQDIAVDDNVLILARSEYGIELYDVSNLPDIEFLSSFDPLIETGGSLSTQQYTFEVHINNGIAYLVDYQAGLSTVDISDPTNPKLLDRFDPGDTWTDTMQFTSSYAIGIGNQWEKDYMQIYDISNPNDLDLVYLEEVDLNPWTVAISEKYVISVVLFPDSENIHVENVGWQMYSILPLNNELSHNDETSTGVLSMIWMSLIINPILISILLNSRKEHKYQ